MVYFIVALVAGIAAYAFRGKIRKALGFGKSKVDAAKTVAIDSVKKEVNKL